LLGLVIPAFRDKPGPPERPGGESDLVFALDLLRDRSGPPNR
jgi:hypothetical protein